MKILNKYVNKVDISYRLCAFDFIYKRFPRFASINIEEFQDLIHKCYTMWMRKTFPDIDQYPTFITKVEYDVKDCVLNLVLIVRVSDSYPIECRIPLDKNKFIDVEIARTVFGEFMEKVCGSWNIR